MNPITHSTPDGITTHQHDHHRVLSRRRFLRHAGAGVAVLATGVRAAADGLTATVRNPLLRTPLALLIDDSCPVVNLGWHWIKARHDWRMRLHPGTEPSGWERLHDKLGTMASTVPADFAREWGEWCGEQGIRGKFSMVPFPAGVGRIDQNFPGHPERELREWLRVTREIIQPNFDITPEILTHTRVVDIKTWKLTDAWEHGGSTRKHAQRSSRMSMSHFMLFGMWCRGCQRLPCQQNSAGKAPPDSGNARCLQ